MKRDFWAVLPLNLVGRNGNTLTDFQSTILLRNNVWLLCFCLIAATPLLQKLVWHPRLAKRSVLYRAAVCGLLPTALLLISTACLVGNSYNPFLYFKF